MLARSLCAMAGHTHLDGQAPPLSADSRTRPTPAAIAARFTDLVQTRRTALHDPRTTIVPPSTGLLLEQVHERVIEAPQQATVRGGYASLLLSYSLLSHCRGSSKCCSCSCCCCCCGCCLCYCVLSSSSVDDIFCKLFLPDGYVLSGTNVSPIKTGNEMYLLHFFFTS